MYILYTHTCITRTSICVIQAILEPGESRAEGVRELEEDLVHDQDGLLPEVRFAGAHQSQDIVGQVPEQGRRKEGRGRDGYVSYIA